ncbi:MAG: YegP family protein [Desulfobacterales bacterium]|nr:YegP family protein [Desulfobacterales bacterium]
MAAEFEMRKTRSGQYVFVLKTAAGKTLLTSEPYLRRVGALEGILLVRRNALRPQWFERRAAAADRSYFVLTTAKGRVLGCGPLYASRHAMEKGIHAVMAHGPAARVLDVSEI